AAGGLAAARVRRERERLVEASRLEDRNHRVDRGDGEKRAEQKRPSSRECPGSADRQQKSIEKHRPRRVEGEDTMRREKGGAQRPDQSSSGQEKAKGTGGGELLSSKRAYQAREGKRGRREAAEK